jgi:hypothetical protein
MSSRLSPVLAAFAEGRWPGERGTAPRRELNLPDLEQRREPRDWEATDLERRDPRGLEPPLHPSEIEPFEREPWSVSRWVPVAFARFMIFFFIGVTATLAWQSYGNAARRAVAGMAPSLGWLAPSAAPDSLSAPGSYTAGLAAGASSDQLAALSRSLAAVRQSVDRLAADVTKLQAANAAPVRTSGPPAAAPPPTAAAVQGRKPTPGAQAASSR